MHSPDTEPGTEQELCMSVIGIDAIQAASGALGSMEVFLE